METARKMMPSVPKVLKTKTMKREAQPQQDIGWDSIQNAEDYETAQMSHRDHNRTIQNLSQAHEELSNTELCSLGIKLVQRPEDNEDIFNHNRTCINIREFSEINDSYTSFMPLPLRESPIMAENGLMPIEKLKYEDFFDRLITGHEEKLKLKTQQEYSQESDEGIDEGMQPSDEPNTAGMSEDAPEVDEEEEPPLSEGAKPSEGAQPAEGELTPTEESEAAADAAAAAEKAAAEAVEKAAAEAAEAKAAAAAAEKAAAAAAAAEEGGPSASEGGEKASEGGEKASEFVAEEGGAEEGGAPAGVTFAADDAAAAEESGESVCVFPSESGDEEISSSRRLTHAATSLLLGGEDHSAITITSDEKDEISKQREILINNAASNSSSDMEQGQNPLAIKRFKTAARLGQTGTRDKIVMDRSILREGEGPKNVDRDTLKMKLRAEAEANFHQQLAAAGVKKGKLELLMAQEAERKTKLMKRAEETSNDTKFMSPSEARKLFMAKASNNAPNNAPNNAK